MSLPLKFGATLAFAALTAISTVHATIPYTPVPVLGIPTPGPGLAPPKLVYGKEYSHDRDFSTLGPSADPQQVIAWDGSGGAADTVDYSGTRPNWEPDQEIDALANSRDSLFNALRRDGAHLVYSHDDLIASYGSSGDLGLRPVPESGPIVLPNGSVIGGAGEVSFELGAAFGSPATHGIGAKQPEINRMPLPRDVDGLELWGPEPDVPDEGEPVRGDADKYSLDIDAPSGVSIWNASGSAYLSHADVVMAVTSLLGPIPGSAFSLRDETQGREAINLDALMVNDVVGETQTFDREFFFDDRLILDQSGVPIDPFGHNGNEPGDTVIFSIRQIVDPDDPDGYYSTGSELFVLNSLAGVSFLEHGGHVWDDGYALSELAVYEPLKGDANKDGVIDNVDLGILSSNYGLSPATFMQGDFNGDNVVNLLDLNLLGRNFGQQGFAESGVLDINAIEAIGGEEFGGFELARSFAVPEPTTTLLALVAIGAVAARHRGWFV